MLQVAHIAGYDDEHHLEKAPILEIDPIPEDRPKSQSLQKYQVRFVSSLTEMIKFLLFEFLFCPSMDRNP